MREATVISSPLPVKRKNAIIKSKKVATLATRQAKENGIFECALSFFLFYPVFSIFIRCDVFEFLKQPTHVAVVINTDFVADVILT